MDSDKKILEVKDLVVSFGQNQIIDNLNFEVERGDMMAIVGPNGAGKTVLFRTLLGFIPHSGQIKWASGIRMGYVPQRFSIDLTFPLTVREFLAYKAKSEKKMMEALSDVGINDKTHQHLDHFLNQKLGQLSGGQTQRVLIAWAFLDNPNVLLFDEPTAGIDIGGEETIYNLLHEMQDKHDLTIFLISHDLHIVYQYTNKVLCLNKQQICFGEPEEVLDQQSLAKLYGGKAKFYHHHEHGHNE